MMNNETQQRGLFHHHFRFLLRLQFGYSKILKSKILAGKSNLSFQVTLSNIVHIFFQDKPIEIMFKCQATLAFEQFIKIT